MRVTCRHISRGLAAVLFAAAGAAASQSVDQRLAEVSADLFARAEHVDADIAELKSILAAEPASAPAHVLIGVADLTKHSADLVGDAADEFREAIKLDPTLIPARLYLARLYLDLGRPARAAEELQAALAVIPGQPQLQALLAESRRQAGQPDAALDLATEVLKRNPAMIEARYYEGLALEDLKRHDEAIQAFRDVLGHGTRQPEVYASLGRACLDAGRVDDAIDSLTLGVTLDSSRPDLLVLLARAYRLDGQLAQAESWLTRARRMAPAADTSPADRQVRRDLSLEDGLIRLKQLRLAAAASAFRQALDLDPNDGVARRYLAEVYLRQGLYERALDQAARAAALGSPLPGDLEKTLQEKAHARPKLHA